MARILITLDTAKVERRGVFFPSVELKTAYVRAVEKAGGVPLLVAPSESQSTLEGLFEIMDGLLVTGGAFDIDPAMYGQNSDGARVDAPKPERTSFEAALMREALVRGRPIFGVCGGMQLLNVVLGGTLIKDIRAHDPRALDHEQKSSPALADHDVHTEGDFAKLLGKSLIRVNSTHHQAVDRLGEGLEVWGKSPDGIIEAIASSEKTFGVQWHPELLEDESSDRLYAHFVKMCRRA